MKKNSLSNQLPLFSNIVIDKIEETLDAHLAQNRKKLTQLLSQTTFTWENLLAPMELASEQLHQFWAPIEQLNATMNSQALREVYNRCIPKLTAYHTEVSQNEDLYNAVKMIAESLEFEYLSQAQKQIIKYMMRDFRLSGIGLAEDKKKRFAQLQQSLAELTTVFEEHVLDSQNAWFYHCEKEETLKGLPEWVMQTAQAKAQEKKLSGWVLTLDFPLYYAVMTHADNAELRQRFYKAYATRASDQADNKEWDNSSVMTNILNVRHELAQILGFENYAELSLVTKMADSPNQVLSFLNQLAEHAKPYAANELQALLNFAQDNHDADHLNAWDVAYYSEKLQTLCFSISQEALRPYFPKEKVWRGLSEIVKRLYGIQIQLMQEASVWHPDVECYTVLDETNQIMGCFYADLYARTDKRGGAWMGDCHNRFLLENGELQLPIAFLNCNFAAPVEGKPCLMTHDDVVTLFHEFGHTLHHLLTKIDYASVSGINGVAWDAVELPSQFMENWCWQSEAIPLISEHYETKEALPGAMLDNLLAAKNFQVGLQMARQLEFSLFDFRLHMEYKPHHPAQIQSILNEVREKVAVIHPPAFNRFQHSFSHIFAGGYAAGYYSYKWAEVLSSDAFARFEEEGIFNVTTGHDFLKCILEMGGSLDAMDLFKRFRGREPDVAHLLKHSGMK